MLIIASASHIEHRQCHIYYSIHFSHPHKWSGSNCSVTIKRTDHPRIHTWGSLLCSPENTPWLRCSSPSPPALCLWSTGSPSASPCWGWTGWGLRQVSSSDSTSLSSDPTVMRTGHKVWCLFLFKPRFEKHQCHWTIPLGGSVSHLFPAVEVHAGQFAIIGLCNVDVQGLALVDVGAAVGGHLENRLLGDFPHGFVELLQIVWDLADVLFE